AGAEICSAMMRARSGSLSSRRSVSTIASRPAPALPAAATSTRRSGMCGGIRRPYSCQPSATQAGMRVPTQATTSSMTIYPRSGLGARGRGRRPEFLEVVESARLRLHEVNDDVGQVNEHPVGIRGALHAQRLNAPSLGALNQAVGHGLDLAR